MEENIRERMRERELFMGKSEERCSGERERERERERGRGNREGSRGAKQIHESQAHALSYVRECVFAKYQRLRFCTRGPLHSTSLIGVEMPRTPHWDTLWPRWKEKLIFGIVFVFLK